jgi:hypothetical protein
MYDKFVDSTYMKEKYQKEPFWGKEGRTWYYRSAIDPCAKEYKEIRELLEWRRADLQTQREENDASYDKALETSYGDTNLNHDLLESHGVKVKLQNGKDVKANHLEQIKDSLSKVYESFGDRSNMAKEFGLKISHSGEKLMFARKAMGLYVPSMKAIGVSDKHKGQFGFTLGHEFAHFIDNKVGKIQGRHYASDNHYSTAGKIASSFRKLMNEKTDSAYTNRTCECFARALEQYHAIKTEGHDAVTDTKGTKYYEAGNHVNQVNFETHIKPLIEQFFQENDHLMKSAVDDLDIIEVDGAFELIKSAFDNEQIDLDTFLGYVNHYEDIKKADASHAGKLVKKTITDKTGKKQTKWVKRDEEDNEGAEVGSTSKEPVSHSKSVLAAFAKETPEKELKRIISESHDEKLRAAAHAELGRRDKKEKPKEEKPIGSSAAKSVKKDEGSIDSLDDKGVLNKLKDLNTELESILKQNGGSFSNMGADKLAELREKFSIAPELNKKATELRKKEKVEFKDNNIIHNGKLIGFLIPSKNVNGYRVENVEGEKITHFENKKKGDLMDSIKDLIITDKDKFSEGKISFENGEYKIGNFKSKNLNAVLSQI